MIPINLIERVEVLPVSASALYSGSPVGGVINIVLRPDVNTTELTTTYTNALGRFDAPQSTTSLLHGETLLGGALHVRLQRHLHPGDPADRGGAGLHPGQPGVDIPSRSPSLFRATPNVSSAERLAALRARHAADHLGGARAPTARAASRPSPDARACSDLALFRPPGGGLADSPNSLDYPYGRKEQAVSFFGSVDL